MGMIEIHPRKFSQRFGASPSAERTFIDTPDVDTVEVLPSIGEEHPEYAALKCTSVSKTTGYGGDPDQTSWKISYAPAPTCEQEPNPLARCDRWQIGTSGSSVAATTWIDNGTTKALVNSAGDPIGGQTKRRLDMKLSVSGNRLAFPIETAKATVNTVNDATWGGAAAGNWLCSGASAQQRTELVGTLVVEFWAISFEFLYNSDGWALKVPDVGLNFINSSGFKLRAYVQDNDGNYVPSPKPLPLNSDGSLKQSGDADILTRPIYPAVNFSTYFGEPPV